MVKDKSENILKKGRASFQLIGKAKVNDYTFKINEEANSGWIYSVINLGVDCGDGNVVYCDMMGGYSGVNDTVIYAHGKKENDNGTEVDDFTNRITVDWDDRFDQDIVDEIGRMCFVTVGLEKDTKGKTFSKSFLSPYDAIEYIQEHLEEGTVINVKGNLKYSSYQGNTQIKKEITSIFLSKVEDPSDYRAKFQQSILVDKDSIGKYDKESGSFPITAYVIDYMGKYGEEKQEIKQNIAFERVFNFEISENEIEKGTKLINKMFKCKKNNINEITVEGDIVEGQSKVNITIDDLPEDIIELIELGAYTEEEALDKCVVGNTRDKKMIIRKPLIRMVGDDDNKKPVVMREDEKYKYEDLVFLSELINSDEDEEEEDKDEAPFDEDDENLENNEYSLDDIDDLLGE